MVLLSQSDFKLNVKFLFPGDFTFRARAQVKR